MEASSSNKIGTFEWIISDFSSLVPLFDVYVNRLNTLNPMHTKKQQRVLVIGCGTSELSQQLFQYGFENIDSLDNDIDCINHMKQTYVSSHPQLHWFHYDLISREGIDKSYFASCKRYDWIIDKGTFDAIHVEGITTPMLEEVVRLLTPDSGLYFLCSINPQAYLQSLFTLPSLSSVLDCNFHSVGSTDLQNSTSSSYCVMVGRRVGNVGVNSVYLIDEEQQMDRIYFQQSHPLLSHDSCEILRVHLQRRLPQGKTVLTVEEVYDAVFGCKSPSEKLLPRGLADEYSHALFMEDLSSYKPEFVENGMTVHEIISFVQDMQ